MPRLLAFGVHWGSRMGDTTMVDMTIGALHYPFHSIRMGVTAENVAANVKEGRASADLIGWKVLRCNFESAFEYEVLVDKAL